MGDSNLYFLPPVFTLFRSLMAAHKKIHQIGETTKRAVYIQKQSTFGKLVIYNTKKNFLSGENRFQDLKKTSANYCWGSGCFWASRIPIH
jgi:hypothetical protein